MEIYAHRGVSAHAPENTLAAMRLALELPVAGIEVDLTSEGQGITVDWYRGRPIGRLFLGQWIDEPGDGGKDHRHPHQDRSEDLQHEVSTKKGSIPDDAAPSRVAASSRWITRCLVVAGPRCTAYG